MRERLSVGERIIGEDAAPYIIAEAGVHHYNSVELAKELILQARIAGADAIKFQTYTADRLVTRWAPTYWKGGESQTQHEIFAARSRLSQEDYVELVRYANELGITFLSTPFDEDAARFLDELGMPVFKIASADLTNHPLLRVVCSFNKPILLSTGASTFEEIREAVDLIRAEGVPLVLLHCSLGYPTPVHQANLARIRALSEAFPDVIIGYSDHTRPQDSMLVCPTAVAVGARVIEKHFTVNKLTPGDDHDHAVDPAGLARLVRDCHDVFAMLAPFEEVTDVEGPARQYARRSVVAARYLSAGQRIGMEDLAFKRPGIGVPPSRVGEIIGKRLKRDVAPDELVRFEDLE